MKKFKSIHAKLVLSFMAFILCFIPLKNAGFAASTFTDVETLAGSGALGFKNGDKETASFSFPSYMAEGENGKIYITDTKNHRIRVISVSGDVRTYAGYTKEVDQYKMPVGGFEDGPAAQAMFNQPKGLAVDKDGNVYVVDSGNGAVRVISPSLTVKTITQDLNGPTDIVISQNGDLYVSDTLNHRIVKVTKTGEVTVVAGRNYKKDGDYLVGGFADGNDAKFNEPTGLAMDKEGNLYVADSGNQRIRMIKANGEVVTVAGSPQEKMEGTSYYQGGLLNGAANEAEFNFPQGIEVLNDGSIVIADTYNNNVRMITPEKQVITLAGTGEAGLKNGAGSTAKFSGPTDVLALDNDRLVVTDQFNNKIRVLNLKDAPAQNKVTVEDIDFTGTNADEIKVYYNNSFIAFDVKPKIVESRTMIPLRQLTESFGYQVVWKGEEEKIYLVKDGQRLILQIGNAKVVNQEELQLDVPPYIDGGRTMVPLRFISEAFTYQVDWLADKQTVVIQ